MLIRLPFDPTKPLDTSDRLVVTFVEKLVEAANILLYLLSKKFVDFSNLPQNFALKHGGDFV